MGYYRKYVVNFVIIADPFNKIKILGFKDSPHAG